MVVIHSARPRQDVPQRGECLGTRQEAEGRVCAVEDDVDWFLRVEGGSVV